MAAPANAPGLCFHILMLEEYGTHTTVILGTPPDAGKRGFVRQSESRLARRPSAKNDLPYCTFTVVVAVLLELTTSCVFAANLAVLVSVLPAAAFTFTVRVMGPQECAGRSKPVRVQVKRAGTESRQDSHN
jgi:hypothetical protein